MGKLIKAALSGAAAAALALGLVAAWPETARAQNIIEEWDSIKAPPPPIAKIKPVQIDPKKTAVFSLDWNRKTCTAEGRVRCFKTLPKIEKLLADARSHNVLVVHALSSNMQPEDIVASVGPKGEERVVRGRGDKFSDNDVEKMLKDRGIDTIIIVGTSANSAVLYTTFGAVQRGFKPIVPIDGLPSELAFQEQFTIWQIANGSQLSEKAVLTRLDSIKF
jgi:nicotinamidase-related amidase